MQAWYPHVVILYNPARSQTRVRACRTLLSQAAAESSRLRGLLLRMHKLIRRARQRAAGWPPEHGILNLAREFEILVGDAARRVRFQLHPDLAPGHRQVRMVPGGL